MQSYTSYKTAKKRYTNRRAKRAEQRNLRATRRRQTRQNRYLLKNQKDLANVLARIVALRAIEAGIIHIPEGEDIDEGVFDMELNLPQALEIADAVAANANNPVPIREQIRIQAQRVQRRGCTYALKLGNLLHVLLSLSLIFTIHYDPIKSPLIASPGTDLVFDKVAGYFSTAATLSQYASLDTVGLYTMCAIGSKALGTISRYVSSDSGAMPMTTYEKGKELFKLAEFAGAPSQLSDFFNLHKYLDTVYLTREAHRARKPLLPTIKESLSMPYVNRHEKVAKSLGVAAESLPPNLKTKKVLESLRHWGPKNIPDVPKLPNKTARRRLAVAGKATMGLGVAALAAAAVGAAGAGHVALPNNNSNNNK
jgi:hypothetical protein